jgi:transposase
MPFYGICKCLRLVVSNKYCIVFLPSFSCVLFTICCQFLWIVNFLLLFRYSLSFINLVLKTHF